MWTNNISILSLKQLKRHPVRSLLTILGVSTGMFIFTVIEFMQAGLKNATETSAKDTTLVVYQQNRFCPFTSRLPQDYERKIEKIPGVRSVYPIMILVNSCSTSLDVVTFRGIPAAKVDAFSKNFNIIAGSLDEWKKRSDSAMLGKILAERRKVKIGDKFDAAGVTTNVSAIIESDNPQNMNVAYVHLDFLQQTSKTGLGIVTQFNVAVEDSKQLESVADAIDETFRHAQYPTYTCPEKAFVARTIKEVSSLVRASRYVAWAAVMMVFALVCNTVIIAVRGRVREYAVMQTIGFGKTQIIWMILVEGCILGFVGGLLGLVSAVILIHFGHLSITTDALSVIFEVDRGSLLAGFAVSVLLGLFSGIVPSFQATRQDIVNNLRAE